MFQIGPSLREARARRGLSPADVHKAIRIRERYLTALEEERWEMLPGDAYTKGFLRTYAEFLGLDGQLYIDEYNGRVVHRDEELIVPESLKRRRGPGPIVIRTLAAAVVVGGAVAGVVAWRHPGSSSPSAVVPPASAAVKQQTSPKTAHRAHSTGKTTAAKSSYTVIRASRDDSWLAVRIGGPTGRQVYVGTLRQGQSVRFGVGSDGLWVRMGRPYALDIRLGGQLVGGLPSTPANIVLTPSGVRR